MAHFAKLNENNTVLEVVVVNNNSLDSLNEEISGITFLTELLGHSNWKQTSYNATIRKNYAGIGMTYDETRDAFIAPKPEGNWVLNEETCKWEEIVPNSE
jgi:hypothetical protein